MVVSELDRVHPILLATSPHLERMPRASLLSQRSPGVQALMQFAMGKGRALKRNWIKVNYLNTRRKTWTQTKKPPREGPEIP